MTARVSLCDPCNDAMVSGRVSVAQTEWAADLGGEAGDTVSHDGFWRDSSGRLTFNLPDVAASDYPAICRSLADSLGLAPAGAIVIGPDQMFWHFQRGNQLVSLDWDIWMEFMAVALSEESESLVQDIAIWLQRRDQGQGHKCGWA